MKLNAFVLFLPCLPAQRTEKHPIAFSCPPKKKKFNERKSSGSNNNNNDKRNYPESLKEPNAVVLANREKVSEQASERYELFKRLESDRRLLVVLFLLFSRRFFLFTRVSLPFSLG